MRQVVLDTETTGLDPALGHRIIEIAAVEIVNRRMTDHHFHRYLNPERESDEAALQVHGITREFLSDKPTFADIVEELVDFVRDSELVIHNAAFDIAFVDYELSLLRRDAIHTCCAGVIDTLKLARDTHPGKRNSLDTLCERYGVDRSARKLHGALLDARLLAEVYLAMTRGQESLIIEEETLQITIEVVPVRTNYEPLMVLAASAAEMCAHEEFLVEVCGGAAKCLWHPMHAPSESARSANLALA